MIFRAVQEASRDTFVYSGRSERLEHWAFLLFTSICVAVFQALGVVGVSTIFPINYLFLLLFAWLIAANVSLMVRRLHDHDLSGFWLLLPFIPVTMMLIAAKDLYGSGIGIMENESSVLLMMVARSSLVAVLIGLGSLFVRPGSKKPNRYGAPVI